MQLVDTHCHLTGIEEERLQEMLENAKTAGVTRFICVGSVEGTRSAFEAVKLAEKYANIWATVGVHPHDAKDFVNLSELTGLFAHPKVVAIGETGLDFYRDWAPQDRQRELFRESIRAALTAQKKLIIHCRDAQEETVCELEALDAHKVGGVFHCYAGDASLAQRLKEMNFMVSFPGSLTFKKADALRETAKAIPMSQIMLETDCPYMAPEPFRGKPSEPAHVRLIAERLAQIKGTTVEEVSRITTENALNFFGIS